MCDCQLKYLLQIAVNFPFLEIISYAGNSSYKLDLMKIRGNAQMG
jgi:hypothetical protein